MKYYIDKTLKEKAYVQLYNQLKRDITDGVYKYGNKLPSKRLIAAETDVSVITSEHAYALLCDEGYVESKERSGFYVIYKESDFITSAEEVKSHLVRHSHQHISDTSISFSILAKTMRKVMSEYKDRILVKSPNFGCHELRDAISSYLLKTQGLHIRPEQIIIGSGAEYLYSLIAQLFFGNTFALENPSYDKIHRVYEACGIKCEMLKLYNDGIRSNELINSSATVLHITPFNSYPSGITASASKRIEYIKWAERVNGYIIEDNYDSELTVSTKNENTVFSLSKTGRVIYMNTFSKTVASSIRIGYMILPETLFDDFKRKLGFYSCTVPVLEQLFLAELLNNGDFERHINRIRRNKRKKLK